MPRKPGRFAACLLEEGSQEFGHRGFGERVRSSPPCDEDRAILLEGHFQDCSQSKFARNSKGQHEHDDTTEIRGWKLFFLLPRILLHRPPRVDWSQRRSFKNELTSFCKDSGVSLLETSFELSIQGAAASCRRRRGRRTRSNGGPHVLSNFANSGSCLLHDKRWREQQSPPGDSRTEKLLKDETRRPRVARTPIDRSHSGSRA